MEPTLPTTFPYAVEIPGLADAVSAAPLRRNHGALLTALRRFEPLASVKLSTTDGDRWLARRKVFTASGDLVAEDHVQWLTAQLASDGGDAGRTYDRLKASGYLLSVCMITRIYGAQDGGTPHPAEFLQIEINLEDEVLDRHLLTAWPYSTPRNLHDLVNMDGDHLTGDARQRVRPACYRLARVIDVAEFLSTAHALERLRRDELRGRQYRVTSRDEGVECTTIQTQDQLFPGWDRFPDRNVRFFDDWRRSSAGLSGARLCDHWALDLSDYTDKAGKRTLGMVPIWTFRPALAHVDDAKGSAYALFTKLEQLDARVKVPFGWFFFMLHGNRVEAPAGERVLSAAEDGLIVLPECDWRVLRDWNERHYSF